MTLTIQGVRAPDSKLGGHDSSRSPRTRTGTRFNKSMKGRPA
jgi:hypothetical protein